MITGESLQIKSVITIPRVFAHTYDIEFAAKAKSVDREALPHAMMEWASPFLPRTIRTGWTPVDIFSVRTADRLGQPTVLRSSSVWSQRVVSVCERNKGYKEGVKGWEWALSRDRPFLGCGRERCARASNLDCTPSRQIQANVTGNKFDNCSSGVRTWSRSNSPFTYAFHRSHRRSKGHDS